MISNILVLGGGSAGFVAAITLKRKLPHLDIRVIRSPEIGIIGVGEGTTPNFGRHFFEYLALPPKDFFDIARPTWKAGIRFLWGERETFPYAFDTAYGTRFADLPRNNGFYCHDEIRDMSPMGAGIERKRVFSRDSNGRIVFTLSNYAFHIENVNLVSYLETLARQLGVTVSDHTVERADTDGESITALHTSGGETFTADLYIDASGFGSYLLGQALGEPFIGFNDTLFCDRAVIGPRDRLPDEIINPYTTAETMDHGWCWQIDHEHHINRGYVYSSRFVSDEDAEAEFRRKNPLVGKTRVVDFRTGRYRRSWVGNVVAVGNSSGFVEPLEATALMLLCGECQALADGLIDSLGDPGPELIALYNRFMGSRWDEIRDFLAIHYRFNTRLDTPFWQAARNETRLHGAEEIVAFYQENGPSLLAEKIHLSENNQFGIEGYLALMVGMRVPHQKPHTPAPAEVQRLAAHQRRNAQSAESGYNVSEVLAMLRDPRWRWV